MVIALGRLGHARIRSRLRRGPHFRPARRGRRRDAFWTRVAERMIDIITAYTGEGIMFAVDTRLRPNGREGTLVQTASAYNDYFANHAEAWEGITYMKSRGVAGNASGRPNFFTNCSRWTGADMARAAGRETICAKCACVWKASRAPRNPLKAGAGGYLRHRFLADVSAPEKRRHLLPGAEHARAHRHHRKDGPPRPRTTPHSCATPRPSIAPSTTGCVCIRATPKASCRNPQRNSRPLPNWCTAGRPPS